MADKQYEHVPKDEAIRRLRSAGYENIATELECWLAVNGKNWGWDGWIRGAYPEVVDVIWP